MLIGFIYCKIFYFCCRISYWIIFISFFQSWCTIGTISDYLTICFIQKTNVVPSSFSFICISFLSSSSKPQENSSINSMLIEEILLNLYLNFFTSSNPTQHHLCCAFSTYPEEDVFRNALLLLSKFSTLSTATSNVLSIGTARTAILVSSFVLLIAHHTLFFSIQISVCNKKYLYYLP